MKGCTILNSLNNIELSSFLEDFFKNLLNTKNKYQYQVIFLNNDTRFSFIEFIKSLSNYLGFSYKILYKILF